MPTISGHTIAYLGYNMPVIKKRNTFIPQNFTLRVKRSRSGRGLFTENKIPKGACIIEYKGKPATPAQVKRDTGKYLFEISKKLTLDGYIPNNPARFINHACEPNCVVEFHKNRIFVFAKHAIKAGEELSYDYDTEYFDRHIRLFGCTCATCTLESD